MVSGLPSVAQGLCGNDGETARSCGRQSEFEFIWLSSFKVSVLVGGSAQNSYVLMRECAVRAPACMSVHV